MFFKFIIFFINLQELEKLNMDKTSALGRILAITLALITAFSGVSVALDSPSNVYAASSKTKAASTSETDSADAFAKAHGITFIKKDGLVEKVDSQIKEDLSEASYTSTGSNSVSFKRGSFWNDSSCSYVYKQLDFGKL